MVTVSNAFNIDRQRVFRDIGYTPDSEPSDRIVSLVNDCMENAHQFIVPSFSYVFRDIKLVDEVRVLLEDGVIFKSNIIARLLEKASKVAVFVLTIGNRLEGEASRLAQNALVLQSTILDSIGSAATEGLADHVEGKISEIAYNQRLTISKRFSPGYCDWDLSQQKMVFKAMKGDYAGVQLTDGCLMIPRKSISGIIGIGPGEMHDYNPCKACTKHNCSGRR